MNTNTDYNTCDIGWQFRKYLKMYVFLTEKAVSKSLYFHLLNQSETVQHIRPIWKLRIVPSVDGCCLIFVCPPALIWQLV